MTDNGRKPLPLATSVWNVEGKKRPVTVPRTSESEIAELATRSAVYLLCRMCRTGRLRAVIRSIGL